MRGRHEGLGKFFLEDLPRPRLVFGVGKAVEEADRDCLDAGFAEFARRPADGLLVERRLHPAIVQHALGDAQAAVARHQRLGLVDIHVVKVRPLLPADLEQVAETIAGDQAVVAPRCWIRALVPTVVPWPK
jgi:hypothetical protein